MSLYYKELPDNAVVCLMSPTASGKTDLAFKLYETGRFELVSVDSALIYQDMNIGTAKPSAKELERYPHHLVNIITPSQYYSVANFIEEVALLIEAIHQRGKLPLLVGGTMMYYMALLEGISPVPETLPHIRAQVMAIKEAGGNQALYEYLLTYDPVICQKLKLSDTQRIGRAVEVHLQTNQTMSQWQSMPKIALSHDKKWRWYALSVMPDRAWLHERIKKRLDGMWQAGFVEEVVEIVKTYPITPDMPSMRCIGYRQVLEFLLQIRHPACLDNDVLMAHEYAQKTSNLLKNHADCTKRIQIDTQNACQEMKNRALYATRQLAKRQYTWLRQLNLMGVPTTDASLNGINHITRASFNCIKEVEKQLIKN